MPAIPRVSCGVDRAERMSSRVRLAVWPVRIELCSGPNSLINRESAGNACEIGAISKFGSVGSCPFLETSRSNSLCTGTAKNLRGTGKASARSGNDHAFRVSVRSLHDCRGRQRNRSCSRQAYAVRGGSVGSVEVERARTVVGLLARALGSLAPQRAEPT